MQDGPAPAAPKTADPTPPATPLARYRALVADGTIHSDPAQRAAVEKLQLLHVRLRGYQPTKKKSVARGWFGFAKGAPHKFITLSGLYLYGGVGRGKSMLMDLFFETTPVRPKRRVHFHAFMREVHAGIHIARESNVSDPVQPVAEEIAEGATLLCFDEFQVSDITDAMLLGRLFEALWDRGVVMVATSNRPPDDLYKDGLNRQLFLPFIAMLKERCDIIELSSTTDYRRDEAKTPARYFSPLGAEAEAAMDAAWAAEIGDEEAGPVTLSVHGRRVAIAAATETAGRASFAALCEAPLGPSDYLAIAERFQVMLIDGVPALGRAKNNEAKRFVTLIDALYEAKSRLYLSAAAPPDALYREGAGSFEFARTASRLVEMTAD